MQDRNRNPSSKIIWEGHTCFCTGKTCALHPFIQTISSMFYWLILSPQKRTNLMGHIYFLHDFLQTNQKLRVRKTAIIIFLQASSAIYLVFQPDGSCFEGHLTSLIFTSSDRRRYSQSFQVSPIFTFIFCWLNLFFFLSLLGSNFEFQDSLRFFAKWPWRHFYPVAETTVVNLGAADYHLCV